MIQLHGVRALEAEGEEGDGQARKSRHGGKKGVRGEGRGQAVRAPGEAGRSPMMTRSTMRSPEQAIEREREWGGENKAVVQD